MLIEAIPAFQDNYIWAIILDDTRDCILVDPGDSTPSETYLRQNNLQLKAILITHHHQDHVGGVTTLVNNHSCTVYGPKAEMIPCRHFALSEGDTVHLDEDKLSFQVIELPGHTLGHIAYLTDAVVFCGDTLFSAGCGRLFEGTPEQMYHSLAKLKALPDETKIYCTHEYTYSNLLFAKTVEPTNSAVSDYLQRIKNTPPPSLPSRIGFEKRINPFLRCDQESVREAAAQHAGRALKNDIEVFAELRAWKDGFRG